ncbi:MAG TPA: sigma-70 family RNA polymerase sigma factor [Bryobacteraceae bacterium]|nr:sigma-70 family RNA polymerase sigma factor [Bryobacteraceae bacterium]
MAPDDELIRRTACGDHSAFDQLVQRYEAAVLRFLRLLARCDAEDILQDTFLAVYRSAAQYRGEASFRTWLFRIAKNAAYQARIRRARHGEWTSEFPALIGYDDPEQQAIRSQRLRTLNAALALLDSEDRQIIVLRDIRGISGEDTARLLGISLAAMKSRLHRARARLAGNMHMLDTRGCSSVESRTLEWPESRKPALPNRARIAA